jgi:hypothetical protein
LFAVPVAAQQAAAAKDSAAEVGRRIYADGKAIAASNVIVKDGVQLRGCSHLR